LYDPFDVLEEEEAPFFFPLKQYRIQTPVLKYCFYHVSRMIRKMVSFKEVADEY